jgi:flagellar motor switch protein FliN/FliY
MPSELKSILRLEVPVIVQLGVRSMTVNEVLSLAPGAIIELPKQSDEELEILVNNKAIGSGYAVKVSENFGLRIAFIGDLRKRIQAMGGSATIAETPERDDAANKAVAAAEELVADEA